MSRRVVGFSSVFVWLAVAISCADEPLLKQIERVFAHREFRQSHWGLLVVDLEDDRVLVERDADKMFAPASVTKLFSVAAALDGLGADHRFQTPVYARGTLDEQGDLHGDLILVASGDLTLGGRNDPSGRLTFRDVDHTYASPTNQGEVVATDPLQGLNDLAAQIAATGVKRVRGEVLIDDRLFEPAQSTGSGPVQVVPIMINDNLLDIRITPAPAAGQPAKVELIPSGSLYTLDAQVDTVAASSSVSIQTRAVARTLIVRGTVPVGRSRLAVHEVDHPALHARALLIGALSRHGVTTNATAAQVSPSVSLPASSDYAQLRKLATHTSLPFSESARVILKVSHNLHASTLPLLLAVKHGERTLAQGMRREQAFLSRTGLDASTISFGGGAGGDRADYVTPRATVQLLCYMSERDDFKFYNDALPILGVDGTLSQVVATDSPARGKVRAKTGTFSWHNALNGNTLLLSKSLAGYADTASGRKIAFAVFVNLLELKNGDETSRIGRVLGHVSELLQQHL